MTKLDFDSLYALPTCILFHIRIQADLLCRNRQQIMSFLETITRFILVILNVFYRYIIRLIFSCLIRQDRCSFTLILKQSLRIFPTDNILITGKFRTEFQSLFQFNGIQGSCLGIQSCTLTHLIQASISFRLIAILQVCFSRQ